MSIVVRTQYPGWNDYPVYTVRGSEQYKEVSHWMALNKVKRFMLSSGSNGYTFQVKSNHEWFMLKWG